MELVHFLSLSSCTYTFYVGFKQRIVAHMDTAANWRHTFEMTVAKMLMKLNELKLNKSECVESQLTKNILNKLFLCLYLQ